VCGNCGHLLERERVDRLAVPAIRSADQDARKDEPEPARRSTSPERAPALRSGIVEAAPSPLVGRLDE
jgi:hypothetical protein